MSYNDDSIVDALNDFLIDKFADLHTCMPGKIDKYEYSTQRAQVKPLLKRALKDGTQIEYPSISGVPVVFPCTLSTGITFPINSGDLVLLLFSEKSLDNWVFSGDTSDTEKAKLHDLSDAIAIPGIISFNKSSIASNNEDLEIIHNSQKITIKSNGDIELGASGLQKLVTEAFVTMFNSHTHTYIPALHPAPAATASGTPSLTMGNAQLTSKAKAQ